MTPYEKRLEQDLAQARATIRATIQAQMDEAGRLDEVIDALAAERDAAVARAETAESEAARLREQVAGARALLLEAGPLIGASTGWPGRRAAWLEANHD